jgi:ketosteroid isomerase-like protein
MDKLYISVILILGMLFSCQPDIRPDPFNTSSEDYLNDSRTILDSLITNKKAATLAELYSENAVCLFGNMDEVSGRQNIKKMYTDLFNNLDSVHIKSVVNEIMSQNDWAIERSFFTFSYRIKDSVNPNFVSGRLVTTFKKNKGRWEIVWQISNSSPIPDTSFEPKKTEYY